MYSGFIDVCMHTIYVHFQSSYALMAAVKTKIIIVMTIIIMIPVISFYSYYVIDTAIIVYQNHLQCVLLRDFTFLQDSKPSIPFIYNDHPETIV